MKVLWSFSGCENLLWPKLWAILLQKLFVFAKTLGSIGARRCSCCENTLMGHHGTCFRTIVNPHGFVCVVNESWRKCEELVFNGWIEPQKCHITGRADIRGLGKSAQWIDKTRTDEVVSIRSVEISRFSTGISWNISWLSNQSQKSNINLHGSIVVGTSVVSWQMWNVQKWNINFEKCFVEVCLPVLS